MPWAMTCTVAVQFEVLYGGLHSSVSEGCQEQRRCHACARVCMLASVHAPAAVCTATEEICAWQHESHLYSEAVG